MTSPHPHLAHTFTHPGVAHAYRHRPPYPAEVFDVLTSLITATPPTVLDIGAGEGALARPLATRVDRIAHVDAVDISPAMIAAGRGRPGGRRDNLRWITGDVTACELDGPYALVTAGASLHWMPWKATMTRLTRVMASSAMLAVVEHGARNVPWQAPLAEVLKRHSRNQAYDPDFSIVTALHRQGHLHPIGSTRTRPVAFHQPIADYIEALHSTSSLARELMPAEEAAAFDHAVEEAVRPWAVDGVLEMDITATIHWGRPLVT